MAVLLYYPRTVPPQEVVHRSLLYWDGIASVVPDDYRLPAQLESLADRDLYFPCQPDWTTDYYGEVPVRRGSSSSYNVAYDSRNLEARLSRALPALPRPADPAELYARTATRLTLGVGKAPSDVARQMVDLGLGVWISDQTLAVTAEAHRLVMSTAALALTQPGALRSRAAGWPRGFEEHWPRGFGEHRRRGFEEQLPLSPYTDDEAAFRWAHSAASPPGRACGLEMELGPLLPVPAPGTALESVVAFREKYTDERVRLMRALHRLLGELRRDYEHPADVFGQLRAEIEEAESDYRTAAKAARMVWVSRSIQVTVVVAAAAAGTVLIPDAGWFLGTVSGFALNLATRETRAVSKAPGQHNFSYLHRVRTELPTPPQH